MSNFVVWWHPGRPAAPETVSRFEAALEPLDIDGVAVETTGDVTMLHAAFNTVPEAIDEHQPIVAEDGLAIVGTIRLDNLDEVRQRLHADGPRTDAHTTLDAYRRWGTESARQLRGDFAYVIAKPRGPLLAVRDHFGVRPLFYSHLPNGGLVLGTTVALVAAHPDVDRTLDETHLEQFVLYRHGDARRTIYRSVSRLPPASCTRFERGGHDLSQYWSPTLTTPRRRPTTADERELRFLFDRAVRRKSRSSGAIAVQVSGGLDSSMVAGSLAAQRPDIDVVAQTVVSPQGPEGEAERAGAVAAMHGLIHDLADFGDYDMGHDVQQRMLAGHGAPHWMMTSDGEAAQYARLRSRGVRVTLAGNGGDEHFNPLVQHPLQVRWWARQLTTPRGRLLLRQLVWAALPKSVKRLRWRLRSEPSANEALELRYAVSAVPPWRFADHAWRERWWYAFQLLSLDQKHTWSTVMGVEVRNPFYDPDLVDLTGQLDFTQAPGAPYRWFQRHLAANRLPPAVRYQSTKATYRDIVSSQLAAFPQEMCAVAALRDRLRGDWSPLPGWIADATPASQESATDWYGLFAIQAEWWLQCDTKNA